MTLREQFPASSRLLTAWLGLALISPPVVLLHSSSPESSPSQNSSLLARDARAILEQHCLTCHGELQLSGLDLRQRGTLLRGGLRGPAVILGEAVDSLLYRAVAHVGKLRMPPDQPPLSARDQEVLRQWINQGVPWEAGPQPASGPDWWSFRKPQRPLLPPVRQQARVQNPIDAFVLARLEEKGLTPAPPADRQTLIRRATFDLIGLPPTPEQVERFVADSSPDAYRNLVEQLLASDRYGERWGRHWLDVVRYAETAGYEGDSYYPNAWRYRDYVIKSFNDDKPYDRFLQEQIAGDQFWPDNLDLLEGKWDVLPEKLEHLEARIGTGLYTLAPVKGELFKNESRLRHEALTDWADVTGAAFMGLTLGCARCHDHKYDPISQRDYYGLQAVFAESEQVEIPVVTKPTLGMFRHNYPKLIGVVEAKKDYRLFMDRVKQRVIAARKSEFSQAVVAAFEVPEAERSPEQQKLAEPLEEAVRSMKFEVFMGEEKDEATDRRTYAYMTEEEREEQTRLLVQMGKALRAVPDSGFDGILEVPSASVLGHRRPELIPEVHVLDRGEIGSPMERARPVSPAMLSSEVALEHFTSPYSRKRLALWLSQPDHPLTARVMVNRIWQWHFGEGLVRTPNDFGRRGDPPTHPQLLDWLATEFVARGWSVKAMHRLIMASNTYQMSCRYPRAKNLSVDPDNRYLWRMNRRRLEGEALWDSMHAVSGRLNLKMGGPPVVPPLAEDELTVLRIGRPTMDGNWLWTWPVSADPSEHRRRGVYILVRRNFPFPMFQLFDKPDNAMSCSKRDVTNVSPQALWFLNNGVVFQQARELAARVVKEAAEPAGWVERAWNLALSRPPSEEEKIDALALLDSLAAKGVEGEDSPDLPAAQAKLPPAQAEAMTKLCVTLFNLNEFLYVD